MGTDEIRVREYTALTEKTRDLARTSQLCWTGSAVAAAVLLSTAIAASNPGLMLPVVLCAAFGFYATVHARRRTRLIDGYLREFHEDESEGAQWYTRLAQLTSGPGFQEVNEWLPLALANATAVVAMVFSWVFAQGATHGELMAGLTTVAGAAFAVHSMTENTNLEQPQAASPWTQMIEQQRRATAAREKRVAAVR